jgi:hypothetical protein
MARKRRKGEHRVEDDNRHKKLKSSQPQDTNVVEILPATAHPLLNQDDRPAQVPPLPKVEADVGQTGSEPRKMTSKKRKRLEKYIVRTLSLYLGRLRH